MGTGSTPIESPGDLEAVLEARPAAMAAYRRLAPSHRREYLEWIDEAKRPETRQRRIEKTVGMLDDQESAER